MAYKPKVFDPRLKLDAINDRIPEELKKYVKTDNIWKWKREKWTNLVGYNYYNNKEYDLRILQASINELEKELQLVKAENEVINTTIRIGANSGEFQKLLSKNKSQIIESVEKNKKLFSVKSFSKLLNLSKNTYYDWKQLNKAECAFSRNALCAKRHPNRLSIAEEEKILEILRDPKYEYYPLSSLIWMAKYENLVYASIGAWTRIRKKNLIVRKRIKRIRKKYYDSLRAEYANQYLHADVTYFKLEGGKTYFIYIVKDNFSKYIKAWKISDAINPETRIDTFKAALADIKIKRNLKITFITDNGNENRANKVIEFFKDLKNIELKFARKDIPFSNSMIEKYNHDLKYMYLYRERIKTFSDLKTLVEIAVKEHNYTKRMEVLKGQTPYEVYNGIPDKSEWILEQWQKARFKRQNRVNSLICCTGEQKKNNMKKAGEKKVIVKNRGWK